MKKIAALLALVLCLMAAGTAMAATKVEPKETIVPATSYGSDSTFHVWIRPLTDGLLGEFSSSAPDVITGDLKSYIESYAKEHWNTDDFKYMLADARALEGDYDPDNPSGAKTSIPQDDGVSMLTVRLYSDVFGGDKMRDFVSAFYNGNECERYNSALAKNGESVDIDFHHLTPVVFAWIPDNTPVAAPLDVPQTGDSSSLPGLFILLGMSVAAMGAMKLRRREN